MAIVHSKDFSYEDDTLYSIAILDDFESSETGLQVFAKIYEDRQAQKPVTGHAEYEDVPRGERFDAAERKVKARLVVERAISSFLLAENE